jgi:hypothetical protein
VVIRASETQVVFDLQEPTTLTLRLRPTKFIHISSVDELGPPVCLTSTNPNEIDATFPAAGRYILTSSFSVTSSVNKSGC